MRLVLMVLLYKSKFSGLEKKAWRCSLVVVEFIPLCQQSLSGIPRKGQGAHLILETRVIGVMTRINLSFMIDHGEEVILIHHLWSRAPMYTPCQNGLWLLRNASVRISSVVRVSPFHVLYHKSGVRRHVD